MAHLLAVHYERHQPERTLLYQVVQKHYPIFRAHLEDEGRPLPSYVQREFDDFLRCGILEHGFLRVRCDHCHFERLVAFSCKRRGFCPSCGVRRMVEASALLVDAVLPEQPIRQWVLSVPYPLRFLFASQPNMMGKVLGIFYRTIASHLLKKAGYRASQAQTGAVTLIQRFGSALNLNIHFHMLFLDGVYAEDRHGVSRFFRAKAPSHAELIALAHQMSHRVGRYLERQGLLSRDLENAYLAFDIDESNPMPHLQGSSIQYRIAMGAQQGRKAFQLQTIAAATAENADSLSSSVAKVSGFSLHAGVCAQANERKKLEQLCRYITRPAISEKRLSLTRQGNVRIQLKTAYRDGTTHVVLEPLDFIARLAALVPAPRVNLTRFHGVFAPHSATRSQIIPCKKAKAPAGSEAETESKARTPAERRSAMTWAQRLKRVFGIDIETCVSCGGPVRIVASIEDAITIEKILMHRNEKTDFHSLLPESRAPPQAELFG